MNIDTLIKEWADSVESEKECLSENKTGMTNFEYGTTVWKDEHCKDCSDADALIMWFNASEGPKNPDKSVDDYSISELFGWLVKPAEQQDDVEESTDYEKARKIGYLGNEKDVAEWLKGDYAKWKQHCLDVFMRLANGDEEKAMEWFNTYDRLSHAMYGTRFGTDHGYVDSEDIKKELAAELGDDEEAIELIKKIDDKWKADAKSLSDFYDSSSSRGGWTGD